MTVLPIFSSSAMAPDALAQIGDASRQLVKSGALFRIDLAGNLLHALLDSIEASMKAKLQLAYACLEQRQPSLALPLVLAEQQFADLVHLLVVLAAGADGTAKLCIGRGVHG